MFTQKEVDRLLAEHHVQPVGDGYIDCICPLQDVRQFLEALSHLGVTVTDYSVWQWVSCPEEIVWGMGGPYNSFGDGWYSELDAFRSWRGVDEMENFLRSEEHRLSCSLAPGLWLSVPAGWKRI